MASRFVLALRRHVVLSRANCNALRLPSHLPMNVAVHHHVPGSKDTYYIPDFVTADEEAYLIRKVSQTLAPDSSGLIHRGSRKDSGDTSAEMETTLESKVCVR